MFFGGRDAFDNGFGSFDHRREPDTKLYDIMGLHKDANENMIKKAYRKLAKMYHPDKGTGYEDKFKQLQHAYDILKDKEKRKIYDEYGEEGLSEEKSGVNAFDFFTGGFNRRKAHNKKGKNVSHKLEVKLEDMFVGATKRVLLTKNVICEKCKGAGSKSGISITCKSCKGSGVKIKMNRLGMNMVQQIQVQCDECDGDGESVNAHDRCDKCSGRKVIKQKKELKVYVDKGAYTGHKIVFHGEADEAPDIETGNVIIDLKQKDHPTFGRDGMNLFIQKRISLIEAILGGSFLLKHLDNRMLKVTFGGNGKIITPEQKPMCIENEGMPQFRSPFVRGGLFVQFVIVFPEKNNFSEDQILKLKSILPPALNEPIPENIECEEVKVTECTLEEIRERQKGLGDHKEAYQEDDDEMKDHEEVQTCRTQ